MRDFRKRFWVDPFQSKLFYRLATYWVIYSFTLFNLLFVWRLLQNPDENTWDLLGRFVHENIPMLVCLLLVVPWMALDAVRYTNRLVGPLVRFRATMKKVAQEEPVPVIRLRQGDFLLEMQDDFNAMLESLEARGAIQLIRPQATATK